jgi:hypothetical protein
MFVTKGGDGGNYEWQLQTSSGANNIQWVIYQLGGQTACSIGGGTRFINTWYHVCGIWINNTKQCPLYINGALLGTGTTTTTNTTQNGTSKLYIGKRGDGYFFNGTIDEVIIYNKSACKIVKGLYLASMTLFYLKNTLYVHNFVHLNVLIC